MASPVTPPPSHETLWQNNLHTLNTALEQISFRGADGTNFSTADGFHLWTVRGLALRAQGRCLHLIGNGASASMSSHFAADIHKNAGIPTQVFTDLALMTAIANDIGYEEVFALPLARSARKGDILLTISSSGNSPNVVRALHVARDLGMFVVTLSAMRPDNASRSLGHLNIYVPAPTYGSAESAHAVILHHWIDLLVAYVSAQNEA